MRIISKQKDYYDGVMANGIDLDLRYIREPKEGTKEGISPNIVPFARFNSGGFFSRLYIIGFCGNIYPVVEISERCLYKELPRPELMIYDLGHLDSFMKANLKVSQYENFDKEPASSWQNRNNRATWKFFFDYYEKVKKDYSRIFDESGAPIFVISDYHKNYEWGIVYNPLLRPFNFAKVKDPYTAFQDIRMWLSNYAAPEKPMMKMTNDENAARLGHGDRYSFRKPPSK